jgi:hypothetical protein
MSLTDQDLQKIDRLIEYRVKEGAKDIPAMKKKIDEMDERLIDVQNAVVQLNTKMDQHEAHTGMQFLDHEERISRVESHLKLK